MRKFIILFSLNIPPYLKCVATLPCEMSSVIKSTLENKTTSEVKHHTFIIVTNFFYKQTQLSRNTDQMPMASAMTLLGTGKSISK